MDSCTLLKFLYTIVPSEVSDITLADHGAGFVGLRQTTATQTTTSTEWSPHHVFKLIKLNYYTRLFFCCQLGIDLTIGLAICYYNRQFLRFFHLFDQYELNFHTI